VLGHAEVHITGGSCDGDEREPKKRAPLDICDEEVTLTNVIGPDATAPGFELEVSTNSLIPGNKHSLFKHSNSQFLIYTYQIPREFTTCCLTSKSLKGTQATKVLQWIVITIKLASSFGLQTGHSNLSACSAAALSVCWGR
jgi:hypothetical protein